MIELNNIKKTYNRGRPNEFDALRDLSLKIESGEMIAIMGRSGAGKSTLMHIIGCLDRPTSGEYKLDGKDVSKLSDGKLSKIRNRQMGIVMQDFALLPSENALQNVMAKLYFDKTPMKKMKSKAAQALKEIGIEKLAKQKVVNMSGGQKQRVAIARAIVNSPDIILADEPTGALDSKTADEIMQVFCELSKKGKTIVIITHEQRIADYCQKTITISDGVITDERTRETSAQ